MNSESSKGFTIRRTSNKTVLNCREASSIFLQGSDVSNIRLVITYGNSVIHGQVMFPGTMPSGLTILANAIEAGQRTGSAGVQADSRGRFVIENLGAGEYEISVSAFPGSSTTGTTFFGQKDGDDRRRSGRKRFNDTPLLHKRALPIRFPGGERP